MEFLIKEEIVLKIMRLEDVLVRYYLMGYLG